MLNNYLPPCLADLVRDYIVGERATFVSRYTEFIRSLDKFSQDRPNFYKHMSEYMSYHREHGPVWVQSTMVVLIVSRIDDWSSNWATCLRKRVSDRMAQQHYVML